MIKKILSTLLVSSALFVFAATGSYAERPTFAVGYTAAYGVYEATGQENEGAVAPQEISKATESGEFGYSSIFMEVSFADRVTVGASWMVDGVETAMQERTDSLCSTAITGCVTTYVSGECSTTLGCTDPTAWTYDSTACDSASMPLDAAIYAGKL